MCIKLGITDTEGETKREGVKKSESDIDRQKESTIQELCHIK